MELGYYLTVAVSPSLGHSWDSTSLSIIPEAVECYFRYSSFYLSHSTGSYPENYPEKWSCR